MKIDCVWPEEGNEEKVTLLDLFNHRGGGTCCPWGAGGTAWGAEGSSVMRTQFQEQLVSHMCTLG